VSSSRRAFLPSHVTIQVYFCDTPQLCKSIWSLTIIQHQFYLDRRAAHKKGVCLMHHTPEHLANLLNASFSLIKINANPEIGIYRLDSSNRSTSDLGLSISSQSTQSILMAPASSYERTEEDKRNCRENSRQLKLKRCELEKLLTVKLAELKEMCIREGNLVGQVPSEIRHCLARGEEIPKVQRRVGTSFSIPLDVMSKNSKVMANPVFPELYWLGIHSDSKIYLNDSAILVLLKMMITFCGILWEGVKQEVQMIFSAFFSLLLDTLESVKREKYYADQIEKLETDLEIQRKIVTAALKLANESGANKFMRKKRRRDYESAQMRLKELNQQFNRIRLGSSRPDLANQNGSNNQLSKPHPKSFRPTKSAPTTPRSSIPDLSTDIVDLTSSPTNFNRCYETVNALSSSSRNMTDFGILDKPIKQQIMNEANIKRGTSISDPTSCNQKIPSYTLSKKDATSCNDMAILEAVDDFASDLGITGKTPLSGYRSQVSYNSTYRRRNYPTLNDNSKAVFYTENRSPLLNHKHELPPSTGAPKLSNSSQNFLDSKQSCVPHVALDHRIGAYNLPNQRTSWDYDCITQVPVSFGALLSSSESLDESPKTVEKRNNWEDEVGKLRQ
uniref:Cytohesin Ubiquitin Protein Inducing domain-containing protein n=1 Tax=Romanomermis culicivorax TaxID=13658 RepID=A0A915IJE4_ROMCU